MAGAAFWDERFAGDAFAYGEAPNAFLASLAPSLRPGMRALVPGDGEGRNGVYLAGLGLEVTTLDLSGAGVAKARRLAAARGVALDARQADALAWDWPAAAYDLVALIYLHLPARERFHVHAEAQRALKPGGLIVLEAFSPRQLDRQREGARGGPREAALLYEPERLREDFAACRIERLEEAEIEASEGSLHVGASAVVRLVARALGPGFDKG